MGAAVKVDEEAKARLEELQAEIRLQTGTSVSLQELLSRLIDDAYDTREEVVDSFRESTVPASGDDIESFFDGTFESGFETDENDIDDILYG